MYRNQSLETLPERLTAMANRTRNDWTPQTNALYERTRAYQVAYEAVQQAKLAAFGLQQKAKGYASKLWTVQTKTDVVKATCGDGASISHTFSYQVGQYDEHVAAKLKKTLNRAFKQRTKSLVKLQYEETACRLWIQEHLAEFLAKAVWDKSLSAVVQHFTFAHSQQLLQVRQYLDVFFQFERSVSRQPDFDPESDQKQTSDNKNTSESPSVTADDSTVTSTNSVLRTAHDWILLLGTTLLEHGGFVDREYLVLQTLQSSRFAEWPLATLIQYETPKVWTNDFEDNYLTVLQLILCGTATIRAITQAPASTEIDTVTKLGSSLDEDDYLALLDQMDITLFFNRLLIEHKDMHTQDGSLYQIELSERTSFKLLAATHHLFDIIIHALERFTKFPVVSKRIAQLLCQLSQILGDHLLVLGPISSNRNLDTQSNTSHSNQTTLIQIEVDRLLTNVTDALIALPGLGLWTFIPSIPFKFVSTSTLAVTLEKIAFSCIDDWMVNPESSLTSDPVPSLLRDTIGKNPGEAIFLLNALAAMAISRHQNESFSHMSKHALLEYNFTSTVVFLLLDVAFLDSDIRGELSKPTREILGSICDASPRSISFALLFVEQYFSQMGDMALYLFRELPLTDWVLTSNDFVILKKFLQVPPLGSYQSTFARYVFRHLSWAAEDNTNGRRDGYVSDEMRKELTLVMADICIHFINNTSSESDLPLSKASVTTHATTPSSPENKLVSALTSNLPQAMVNLAAHSGIHLTPEQAVIKSYMDWCWTMLHQIRPSELAPLSVVEESRLHVADPGLAKYALFSQGQFSFVNTVQFLLTGSSRDPDQFLTDGWRILTGILQAGASQVFLELLAKLVPPIIFSAADVSAHAAKLGLLLREMSNWKQDPMLAMAGIQFAKNRNLSAKSIPSELTAISALIQVHLEEGRIWSYNTLDKKILQFWLSAVFSQKDWMAHQEYVQVMDSICLYCFELGLDTFIKDALTEQQILLSIGFRRAPGMSAEIMGMAQPSLDKVMDLLPSRLLKALPVPQGSNDPSLLMGTWSIRSFATTLVTQQAAVETHSIWFAYSVLLVETQLERDMRLKVGTFYQQHPDEVKVPGNIKAVMKTLGIPSRKTLQNFAIWRWAQHLLILPFETYLLPLFWQMFFHLYFGHVEQQQQPTVVFYGFKFLETHPELVEQLKDRLQKTYSFIGAQARNAIQERDPSLAESLTSLHEFYIALYGWINEPLLLTSDIDLKRIRKDLMPQRLATCRLPDPLECNPELWRDVLVQEKETARRGDTGFSTIITPSSTSSSLPGQANKGSSRAPNHSHGYSSRIVRKHSHAWHEQKISNSLVRHAKPKPEIHCPRQTVVVPLVDEHSTAKSLFGHASKSMRAFCKTFKDTSEAYEHLDTSYLKELAALYHNEVKTSRLDIACDTTPTMLCKKPAMIELRYEEIVVNEQVKISMVENRERARAMRVGGIHPGLCVATMEIEKVIQDLLTRLEQEGCTLKDRARLHDVAVKSFFYLLEELLEDAQEYAPALVVLHSIVETLGMRVVSKDPAQTEPILDFMKTNDFRITLMSKTFYPAALPKHFVRLYRRIATFKDYTLSSKDRLLRQFDVQAWALGQPLIRGTDEKAVEMEGAGADPKAEAEAGNGLSVLDRLAFYEVAFSAMVTQQQQQDNDEKVQESTEMSTRDRLAIIRAHRELAGTLFVNFLQQDYVEYLRILFDTCGTKCLEPEVLEDFIRILGVEPRLVPALLDGGGGGGGGNGLSDIASGRIKDTITTTTTVGLSDYDLGYLIKFLGEYFTACQNHMAVGNLLDRFNGYVVSIANLLTVLLCEERYLTQWLKSFAEHIGYSTHLMVDGHIPANIGNNGLRDDAPVDHKENRTRSSSGLELIDMSQCRIWHDTLLVFQPWLSCLTDRAVGELQFQRQQSGASRIVFAFVGIVSKMMDAIVNRYRDNAVFMEALFGFYLDLIEQSAIGGGSVNQIMLIHQHFHRIEWKGLEWRAKQVQRILSVVAKVSEETRIEVWTYIFTDLLDKVDSDLRPRRLDNLVGCWHEVTETAFLKLGLVVLQDVQLVAGNDVVMREQILDRLWTVVFGATDWTRLDQRILQEHVSELAHYWAVVGSWDSFSSPLGVLLHWMRLAVGLERTDLNAFVEEEEDGRDDQDEASVQGAAALTEEKGSEARAPVVVVDRVLIYFEYVLQLVQAHLSSSAEDSQSVNFRMSDVPMLLTHLGHVLDIIAGDREQTRHIPIHRAVLALVGILNQFCKGPHSFSPSPSPSMASPASNAREGSFEIVLYGLKRMVSEVEVIQLDIVRSVCLKVNSIPAMVNLLEEAIEREFWLWEGAQGSSDVRGLHRSTSIFSSFVHNEQGIQGSLAMQGTGHVSCSNESSALNTHVSLTGHQRDSWMRVKSTMEAPELSKEEFLEEALKQGSILTIYGLFLQHLEICEASQDFDQVLELGQELAQVISKVDMQAIEPWKAYQSLLLLRMFLRLVAKESVHSVLQSRFLKSLVKVCQTLEVWCQDRDPSKGMLSSIGMGTRSSFDTKFRLVVRIVYTYLVVRLADKGVSIHQDSETSSSGVLAWRRNRKVSHENERGGGAGGAAEGDAFKKKDATTTAVLIETLEQLPVKNKDYAAIFSHLPLSTSEENSALGRQGSSLGPLAMSSSIAFGLLPPASFSISSASSSPLGFVKRTILPSLTPSTPSPSPLNPQRPLSSSSSSPAPSPSPSSRISNHERSGSTSTLHSGVPAFHHHRQRNSISGRTLSKDLSSSAPSALSNLQTHKRNSSVRHQNAQHSRFSSSSSWDDSASSLLLYDRFSHDPSSGSNSTVPGAATSLSKMRELLSTQRKYYTSHHHDPQHHHPLDTATLHNNPTLQRLRLQYGTQHEGLVDFQWAVQQVKDRRFRILEASDLLSELLNRFYQQDDYFA
ncbi:hypothetical protein BGZ94_007559 [Podila epigama]|nr:hypothetical protein BGZ94_007559 [Podila epigama]